MTVPTYAWDFSFLWHYRSLILFGLGVTIAYTIGTILIGLAIGLVTGLLRLSRNKLLTAPLVAGEIPTSSQRVAAAADFASGVANPIDVTVGGAINADLTIAMHRPLRGEWVGLDARAWADPQGTGMAEAVIHDTDGPVGRSLQSLLVR